MVLAALIFSEGFDLTHVLFICTILVNKGATKKSYQHVSVCLVSHNVMG